jgi:hypothetical protein
MPIIIELNKEEGIVYTTIDGRVSTDEIIDGLKKVLDHPDFRPGLRGIVDIRPSELDTHAGDVRRIADLLIEYRDRIGWSRSAVVVATDLAFGMTKMFQAFNEASSIEVEIFQDIEEARQWLEKAT